jgi:DNA-binding MarR family transcriptional regulator
VGVTGTRWLDDREARAWRAYVRMSERLDYALGQQLARDSGLSDPDYEILVVLSETPGGRLRYRDLAKEVCWERSRLSHQVARMARRGLVARDECADDARGAFVRLTPDGRRAIEEAAPGHVDAVRRHFIDVLDEDDLDRLADVCERVIARLDTLGAPGDSPGRS